MFVASPSGFTNTPVSKFLIYTSLILSIAVSLLEIVYLLDFQIVPHLIVWHQWWRVLLNQILYVTQSEILVFTIYLYNMRLVERLLGSNKFISFIVLIYLLSLFVVPFVYVLLDHTPFLSNSHYSPPGPTTIVFALLSVYRDLVPVVYRFQLTPVSSPFKLNFSDKSFIYIMAADLAVLRAPGSLINAAIGWTLGGLIHNEAIPGKHWRIPLLGSRKKRPSSQQPSTATSSSSSSSSSSL